MKITTLIVFFILCFTVPLFAAETRGLNIIAKDTSTGQQSEVKLYNKAYAVVIGIDRYKNLSPDRQLKNAVKDANGVEAVIRKHYRFDKIFVLHDEEATRDNIMRLLTSELLKTVGKDDALFIFWAGHGNQEKTDDGDLGYLIPYDGRSDGIYGNITMSQLKDDISRAIPAKHVFYAFDACYSGLLTSRSVDKKVTRNLAYLQDITKERVRQVLTAGSKGQEALDGGPRGHSVFTGRLIEILEATGDYVTANEIQAILKERVYQDARARGHEQTPGFGTLYGSGDFVFIPNIEQKVQDNKAELARMEAELKELELSALQSQDDQKRQDAERQKRVIEARIKAEELKKKQLAEEQLRLQQEEQKRAALEAAQKEDEAKLSKIKAELERKKQQLQSINANTIEAAVAEIKRINAQIAVLDKNTAPAREQMIARYDQKIAKLNAQQRDEFEKDSDFKARIQKELELLESRKNNDLDELAVESTALREELKRITEKKYTLDSSQVQIELGKYDVERELFPVTLKNKDAIPVLIAMNGSIPFSPQHAKSFKQQFESGLLRPQMQAKASGEIVTAALVNEAENYLLEYTNGEFLSEAEKKKRAERERIIFTDPTNGLMWVTNGNIAGKGMTWHNAMSWVKQLNYGGYTDWRLPTKEELEAFSKRGGERPYQWFNANGFNNVQSNGYWSSSSNGRSNLGAWYSGDAWYVVMNYGKALSGSETLVNFVWPVHEKQ